MYGVITYSTKAYVKDVWHHSHTFCYKQSIVLKHQGKRLEEMIQ